MRKNMYLLVILLVSFLTACVGTGKVVTGGNSKIARVTSYETMLVDTSLFKSCRFVALETNDTSFLKRIDRIYMDDEKIFIFDSSGDAVAIFDESGHFLGKIHDIGSGPQEYIQAVDITIDTENKYIILLCDRPHKLIYYSYDGMFVKELHLSELYNSIVEDKSFLYCYSNSKIDGEKMAILRSDDGQLVNEFLFPETEHSILKKGVVYQFARGNYLTKGGGLHFARQFDNSLYHIEDQKIIVDYTVDFGEHVLPNRIADPLLDIKSFVRTCDQKKYVCSILEVIENKRFLIFSTNIGLFIVNKDDNTVNGYGTILNTQIGYAGGQLLSIGNQNNKIALICQPDMLKRVLKYRVDNKIELDKLNVSWVKQIDSLNEEANPVLIIYEM